MILRRLLAAGLMIGTTAAPSRSRAPLPAPTESTTATMHLVGRAERGGAVHWRVANVTYRTTGASAGRAEAARFAPSLAVTVQNALSWSVVYPGVSDRIQTNSVPSGDVLGIFKLTGSSIKTTPTVKDQFQCYFGFPTTATSASPSATMPIAFAEAGYTYGGTSPNPTPPGTAVDLTQYSSTASYYVNRLTGTGYTFYFFVGGRADPATLQTAATYTTSISITCSLTGL